MKNHSYIMLAMLALSASLLPFRAHAYGLSADGGDLKGLDTVCTCSASETIKVHSYVDDSDHVYLYMPGVTQLYANYNLQTSGGYFLATLTPGAVCLVYHGEECDNADSQPEGIFGLVGTSFKNDKSNILAALDKFPMVSNIADIFSKAISMSRDSASNLKI